MDEFELIDRLIAPLAAGAPGAFALGNDAAVIEPGPGCELVITKDMMAEGVHFLADDPPGLVARKLLRTNLSDLAAMGARPLGYLLGLGLDGRRDESWLTGFFAGLALDQAEFGVALFGGDTISAGQGVLTLSLTALGEVARGASLTRSGAHPGDIVGVSGTIGDGALGLLVRRGELAGLGDVHGDELVDRYRLPRPRVAFGMALVGLASAALDVSDGLLADAGHIARRSGCGVELQWADVPLSAAARAALATDPALVATIVGGGDDYELLFAAPPGRWPAIAAAAAVSATPVARIGQCVGAGGVRLLDGAGRDIAPARRGWRHAGTA